MERAVQDANNRAFDDRRFKEEAEVKVEYLSCQLDIALQDLEKTTREADSAREAEQKTHQFCQNLQKEINQIKSERMVRVLAFEKSGMLEDLKKELIQSKNDLQQQILTSQQEVENLKQEIYDLKKVIADQSMRLESFGREKSNLELEISMTQAEAQKAEQLLSDTRDLNNVLGTQVQSLERNNHILVVQLSESEKAIRHLKENISEQYLARIQVLEKECQYHLLDKQSQEETITRLGKSLASQEIKINELVEKLKGWEEEKQDWQRNLEGKESYIHSLLIEVSAF